LRKLLIAGNWKMNKLRGKAVELIDAILMEVKNYTDVDIAVFPTFLFLDRAIEKSRKSNVDVGAQNVFYKNSGAYTGEISPPMLKDLGCKYVILGHSERRRYFGETNAMINKKVKSCLESDLLPVLCIGESLKERENGRTFEILNEQIIYGFEGIDSFYVQKTVIAYEPVWAIGTGMSATSAQAAQAHSYIRDTVKGFADTETANQVRILYGGSVNTSNAHDLLKQEDIDGALIGGASLQADSFCEIVRIAALIN